MWPEALLPQAKVRIRNTITEDTQMAGENALHNARTGENEDEAPQPGGFPPLLAVTGVIAVLLPVRYFAMLFSIQNALADNLLWNALKSPGSPYYDPVYRTIAYTEIFIVLFFCAVSLANANYFFRKKKNFPSVFIVLLLGSLFFTLGQTILFSLVYRYIDRNTMLMVTDLVLHTVFAFMLIPYVCYSQKVKERFINN